MKKIFPYFLLVLIICIATYFSKYFLLYKQDTNYLLDRFAHSQWSIPLSTRKISDDQLYYVAAIRLSKGDNPFNINPEVPPLGKYLYALGIIYFNNPYIVSLILFVMIILLTVYLSKIITKNIEISILAGILVASSPAFASQISVTMLELPLTFFLLLHIYCLFKYQNTNNKYKKNILMIISGIAFGGFAATKFPLFVPILLITDFWFFYKNKDFLNFFLMSSIAFIFYMASYLQYFLLGHSLIEWARSIYWTIKFYANSNGDHTFLQLLPTIFIGQYWNGNKIKVLEWTILWPIIFVYFIFSFFKSKKIKNNLQKKYLIVFSFLYSLLLLFVDFRARYFFPLIPILSIILITIFIDKIKIRKFVLLALLTIIFGQLIIFFRTGPEDTISQIKENWNESHYQEVYSFLNPQSVKLSRDEFHKVLNKEIDQNLMVNRQKIDINFEKNSLWKNELNAIVTINRETEFGDITNQYPATLKRIENKWFLNWQWNFVVKDFEPNCNLSFQSSKEKGKLITNENIILSQFAEVEYTRLNLTNLKNTPENFSAFAEVINNLYPVAEDILQNKTNGREWLNLEVERKNISTKSSLNPYISSWYKQTRQTTLNFNNKQLNKIQEIEKNYPELFAKAGGTISVSCPDKKYQIEIPSKRKDVILNESLLDILKTI